MKNHPTHIEKKEIREKDMANSFRIPYMISKQSNHQSTNLLFLRTQDSE